MRVLHLLDHSVPLHSGYSFRTLALLQEQRTLIEQQQATIAAQHEQLTRATEQIVLLKKALFAPRRERVADSVSPSRVNVLSMLHSGRSLRVDGTGYTGTRLYGQGA